jgi:hypothetical protein
MPYAYKGDYLTHKKKLGQKRAALNAKYRLKKEFLKLFEGILGECKTDGVDRERESPPVG